MPLMYSAFRADSPHFCISERSVAAMRSGVMSPNRVCSLPRIALAALFDIYWATMPMTSAEKGSGLISRLIAPMASIAAASFLSRRLRWSISVCPYLNTSTLEPLLRHDFHTCFSTVFLLPPASRYLIARTSTVEARMNAVRLATMIGSERTQRP